MTDHHQPMNELTILDLRKLSDEELRWYCTEHAGFRVGAPESHRFAIWLGTRVLYASEVSILKDMFIQAVRGTRLKCWRGACNAPAHPELIHKGTGRAYCPRCARSINEACGEEVVQGFKKAQEAETR